MNNAEFKFELDRKLFHFSSALIPLIYIFTSKLAMCLILLLIATIILYIDISRHYNKNFQGFVDKFFKKIMRPSELSGSFSLTGISFFFLGALLVTALFSKGLAIASISVWIFADSAAALVGVQYGLPIRNGKSIIGSCAFFCSATLISTFCYFIVEYATSFKIIIIASIFTTIAEFYSKELHINDNFFIPLIYGLLTFILSFIF